MNDDSPASSTAPRPLLHRDRSSQAPRGILKKADDDAVGVGGAASPPGVAGGAGQLGQGPAQGQEGAVHWDEVNLSLNDVNRDSTMRITEPKTPYVRYNAETDEVMDLDKIPGFELGQTDHQATATGSTTTEGEASNNSSQGRPSSSSRSSSFSGSRRGSESSRRSSDIGERKMVVVEDHGPGVDAEDEGQDEETRAARKQFKQRRNSHYEGEGEVMKRFKERAAAKALEDGDGAEDEPTNTSNGGDATMSNSNSQNNAESAIDDEDDIDDIVGEEARRNARANSQINGSSGQYGRSMPPVPPIPNGYA